MPTVNLGRVKPIHRGAYNGATTYQPLDYLTYNGVEYHCIATSTGNLPTDAGFFSPVVDTTTKLDTLNPSYSGTLTGGTGVVNLGSGQVYKDATGNVGIGTASPAYKLDVRGAVAAGNGTITGGISYSTRTEIGSLTNHDLGLITNNTTHAVLNTSGNLGLGTTSPTLSLEVAQGTAKGYMHSGSGVFSIGSKTNHAVTFDTNNIGRMSIDTSGNLGLGVTPSAWGSIFRVMQLGSNGSYIAGRTDTSQINIGTNSYWGGSNFVYSTNGPATRYSSDSGAFAWQIAPSGTAGNPISFTQAMALDASGNLSNTGSTSFGTSGSSTHTFGNSSTYGALMGGGGAAAIYLNGSTRGGAAGTSTASGAIVTATNDACLWTNAAVNVPKMALDASGNLLVGSASSVGSYRLQVTGSAIFQNTACAFRSTGDLGSTGVQYHSFQSSNGIERGWVGYGIGDSSLRVVNKVGPAYLTSAGGSVILDNSGNLLIGTTTAPGSPGASAIRKGSDGQLILVADNGGLYHQAVGSYYLVTTAGGSTSDERLKENVTDIHNALEKVRALRGVNFTFIDEPLCGADRGVQLGVLAQNIEEQFPEIVITDDSGKKSVRYDRLVAPLIGAVKELADKIDAQNAAMQALADRLSVLEAK